MAGELLLPRRSSPGEESLAAFVRRRFGREVYDRLVQPLIAGIYTGDPEQLSLEATMPRFLQMETEHGSLIRALWKQRKSPRNVATKSSGARYSQFVAPLNGMSSLVQALHKRLASARVLLGTSVERIKQLENGGWQIFVNGTKCDSIEVDAMILATPAQQSAILLSDVDSTLAGEFAQIKYGSCALVSIGFRRDQIDHPLDGFGFVVPLIERRQILSCSFSSIKYARRAPDGHVLLRTFVGGASQSGLVELDDEQLQRLVLRELSDLLRINGSPHFCHVTRQRRAMPQYYVGHQAIVQRIQERAAKSPNLALAGNALQGIGVPNCIQTGEQAAEHVIANPR